MHENTLCKLSSLCDGILPFFGSAAAFVTLMVLLVF